MKRVPLDLYKLIEFGLGGDTWQQFVDHYNDKYDELSIDGFEFAPTKINYTWSQLISSTGAKTLPAYVDPESPGYEKALREVQGQTGNIPTQKAFYSLNRVTVLEKMQLVNQFGNAALTPEMQDVFLGLLDESTDGLIQGYYNSLTNQRMRIVSTGKFTIDVNNNPRGLQGITLDFGIDSSHFDTLSGTARWWTDADRTTEGTAADPITYMKKRVKYIRKNGHVGVPIHIEISDALWQDVLMHSAVLKRIGYLLQPLAKADSDAVSYAQNLADDTLKAAIERIVGVPIVVRDTLAFVDKPNATTHELEVVQVENFNPKNIAFVPDGRIGSIQGVSPLTLGYDADKVATFNDGRLVLTQRAVPETHSIYIESEAAQLSVPSVPQYMYISTVTA